MADIGDVLDQRYRLIKSIGCGKWGQVFLAENLKLGNRWAVKEVDMSGDSRVNLLAEPEILKRLNHPHIPRIVDVIVQGNKMYIIEDFFEGVNLKELIAQRERCTERNVIHWGKQLTEVLVYLHHFKPNPIIYRDMKPGNIIIDNENNARLIDFGIARTYDGNRKSDTVLIGTMGYAAPELFMPGSRADGKADIYGLGMTLYHVLTGLHPSGGVFPVRKINPALSVGIEKILLKSTDPQPQNRYSDASELLEALRKLENKSSRSVWGSFAGVINRLRFGKKDLETEGPRMDEGPKGSVIIAVAGAGRRVGCTHTALVLAQFLARVKYKVALAEMNPFGIFEHLNTEPTFSNNNLEKSLTSIFNKNGVDFYSLKNISDAAGLGSIIRKGYHYIVLDLGNTMGQGGTGHLMVTHREFQRAHLQILVSGSAVWQLPELLPYLKDDALADLKLVMTNPDSVLMHELKGQINKDIYQTVFNPNPFNISREQDQFCMNLLKGILMR